MQEYPAELRKKYVVSRELGTGACGLVRLAFHADSRTSRCPVAVKIISKRQMTLSGGKSDIAMNEVKILRAVDHPAIIRLEDVVETDSHIYIVLELAVGGELFDKIIQVRGSFLAKRNFDRTIEHEKILFLILAQGLYF